jgi:hypothetical protein
MSMHLSFIIIFKNHPLFHNWCLQNCFHVVFMFARILVHVMQKKPTKNSPIVEFGNPIHWCETLMRCRINEPIHWFICSLGYGGVSMNVTLTIIMGLFLPMQFWCPHQWPSPNGKPNECRNPNQFGTLCTCMSCNCVCTCVCWWHNFLHPQKDLQCFYGTLTLN